MKFIILGLGTLGHTMARILTEQGDDVIGVDNNISKVEEYKDDMSSTICLDVSEYHALTSLPIKDVDAVVVAIGNQLSVSIQAVAYVKKLGAKRILARSNSSVETAILNAIGIDEIMKPGELAGERYSFNVSTTGIKRLFPIDDEYRIYETLVAPVLIGNSVESINFKGNFKMQLITIKRESPSKNFFGDVSTQYDVLEGWNENTLLQKNDILVLFGKESDFSNMKKTLS
ncbi:MAG: TrkA family potassium uptake protein [Bacteroidales bacterium]